MKTSAIAVLALLLHCMSARAQTFVFAPPNGYREQQTSRRDVVTDTDGKPESRDDDVTDTVTNVEVTREGDTIRVASTVRSTSESDNGKPFSNPAFALIINRTVTDIFDRNGTFLHIQGNENLVKEAEKIFPDRVHAAIEQQFEPARLESGERLVWQLVERGPLVGHAIKLNERWASEEPTLIRSKALTLSVVSRVAEIDPPGKDQHATVITVAATDPAMLKPVDKPGITSSDDAAIQDFLTWNVADLPVEKVVSRVTVDTKTLRLISRDKYIVDVDQTPAGIKTRTEHETITCKPLD